MEHSVTSYLKHLRLWLPRTHLVMSKDAGWRRDPLSHPDIQRMSERERADLQFDPKSIAPE